MGRFHTFIFVSRYSTLFLLVINFPKSNLFCPWWWLASDLYLDPSVFSSYFFSPALLRRESEQVPGWAPGGRPRSTQNTFAVLLHLHYRESVHLEYKNIAFCHTLSAIYKAPEYLNVNAVISWLQQLKSWIKKIISSIDLTRSTRKQQMCGK